MDAKINYSGKKDGPEGCGPLLHVGFDTAVPLRQQVFEFVRAQGRTARSDITNALGISAGSATTLTADLIAAGLVCEIESFPREAARGRPKVALEIVRDAAFAVGIKLSFNRHTAVLTDFGGNVVADASVPTGNGTMTVQQIVEEISRLIKKLLAASGRKQADVKAVGVGLPGMIDHATGNVMWSPLLRTQREDLSQIMTEHFSVPVLLDNDANMLTLAELWFGEGRSMSDFAVVTVESGVGMGIVLGNQLYRGAHGMGLELGHTKVQLDGALCQCGQRGCLEAYLADYALVREAATALGHAFDPAQDTEDILATLFEQAKSGHMAAETIFRRAGRYLALGLSNVVQLFDPEKIILSGERMQNDYLYAEDMINTMNLFTLNVGREPCEVTINRWGDLGWARGASALALSEATNELISGARTA